MTPEPKKKDDWTVIENVLALLETHERKLTLGEKQVIAGQRIINGILYQAISAILGTFPDDESAPQAIRDAKKLIADLPGHEPPGCCENPESPECKQLTPA